MTAEQPVDYRPHPNTSLEVRISNAIHALNLTRPDIAALKDGQSIVCNITDRRVVGALLEDIQSHLKREVSVGDRIVAAEIIAKRFADKLKDYEAPHDAAVYGQWAFDDLLQHFDIRRRG